VDDGSASYEETWSLGWTIFESHDASGNVDRTANRFIQGVPKNKVKDVLDSELALSGNFATAGFRYSQKVYWREDSADIATESRIVNELTDSNTSETVKASTSVRTIYENTSAIPDAAVATQGKTERVQGSFTSDGKFNYTKEVDTAVKQEIASFTALSSASKTETEKSGKNLYDADLATYEPISATVGHVVRLSKTVNADGTYNDVVSDSQSISQTASIDGTHSDQHLDADDRTEDTVRATAASAPEADVAFTTQGTIVEVQNAPNEDGTFRTDVRTVVSKEQEILDSTLSEDKFKTVKADIGKQIKDTNLAAHYPIVATTGEVRSRRISENSDGTFDVVRDRDIAKTVASVETSSEIQAFETIARDVDKNNATGDTPPEAQTAGTIKTVTNRVNEYDRVDVSVETRTAVAVSTSERNTEARAFDKTDAVTDRNQAAIATPQTTQTAGTIVSARGRLNEFAKYDNTVETKTAVPVSATEKITSVNAFDKDERISDKNQATIVTPITSQVAGTIKTAVGRLNEFGLYDNEAQTKTAVEKTVAGETRNVAADSVATTVVAKNISEPADISETPVDGTIKIQAKRLNEFGLWDAETTDDVRKDQSLAIGTLPSSPSTASTGNVSISPRSTSITQVLDGVDSPPIGLAPSEYGAVSYRKDRYGRYVGEKTVTTYNDTIVIPGWQLSSDSRSVSHTIRTTYKGKGYKRDIAYTIYETQTSSANTARAFAGSTEARTALVGTEAGSSAYHPLANGQYYAIRIEADDANTTGWSPETDGDFP
jgi:hypothetical protein